MLDYRRVEDLNFDEEAIDAITKAVTNKTSSHYAAKDKYLRLPISEVIDTARCEKLSISYVQVPEDYPKLTFSARCATSAASVHGLGAAGRARLNLVRVQPCAPFICLCRDMGAAVYQ